MLMINRIRIEVKTRDKIYGLDESFQSGLNLIASDDNTRGKSSILAMIYYCLGLEEIIGGKGEKVLTSTFKSNIEDGSNVYPVLESGAYLEISNRAEVITIFRTAKMENRDSRLITVYYTDIDNIHKPETLVEDMYVHMPHSATNKKGFHKFLETFLHLSLPYVPASDDANRKLYLQLIFSGMFIEQKHGWSDILSGMPLLGIRESKKRIIEFLINLDTLENEKRKEGLRLLEEGINKEWNTNIREITSLIEKDACNIYGLPLSPKILTDLDFSRVTIKKNNQDIDEYLLNLTTEYSSLTALKPKIVDNFEALQFELNETEVSIRDYEQDIHKLRSMLDSENISIKRLKDNLEIIETDITNNKDTARLRELGSELDLYITKDVCPTCHQEIADTLLPVANDMPIMSIDENIRHLNAQKEMLSFAKLSHEKNKENIQNHLQIIQEGLFKLRALAKSLRSDLYQTNDSFSEAIVYKKLKVENEINSLTKLMEIYSKYRKALIELSSEWKDFLDKKAELPDKRFSEMDIHKMRILKENFVDYLIAFGYKSVQNLHQVEISKENYLPAIEGFDMKFDSSASDNIRAIWAFTLALLHTSKSIHGNHPGVIIFDEPAQQSMIPNDTEQFFHNIIGNFGDSQVIIGITVKDTDTRRIVDELPEGKFKLITVANKALQVMDRSI